MEILQKKTVRYTGEATEVNYGNGDIRAYLIPLDHTNPVEGQHAENNIYCTTSKVQKWDKLTGIIETTYSIYVPETTKE